MLNNLVVWNRIGSEGSQHAYFPGRGVHTAWEEIFHKLDAPCIYEFDLSGFFDNVDLGFISKALSERYSAPVCEVEFFEKMNKSIVKLCSEDALPEPDRKSFLLPSYRHGPNHVSSFKYFGTPGPMALAELERMGMKLQVEVDDISDAFKKVGVPQGAATSCSLSTIAIHEVTDSGAIERKLSPNGGGIVMYADDGVIFLESSDDLAKVLDMFQNSGVSINESKSG
jgi:hypothetical protein